MDSEDNILDLPVEQPYRAVCIEYLTKALVEAEQGEILSLCFVAQNSDGSFQFWATPTDNVQGMGSQLILAGVRRLGFAFRSELEKKD